MQQSQFDNAGYGASRNSSPPIQMVELSERPSSKTNANEYTPLTLQVSDRISESLLQQPITSSVLGASEFNDDSLDFFKVIFEELNKINNFFIGKLAQLQILLEEITRLDVIFIISVSLSSAATITTTTTTFASDMTNTRVLLTIVSILAPQHKLDCFTFP